MTDARRQMTTDTQLADWNADIAQVRESIHGGQRPTFTARAIADSGFWYIEIDGIPRRGSQPGAFTQARTRDEIEPMARDVIAVVLEVPPDSFDLLVEAEGNGPT